MTLQPYDFTHYIRQTTDNIIKNWPQWKKDLAMPHDNINPDRFDYLCSHKPINPPKGIKPTRLQFGPLPGSISKVEGAEWISTDNFYLVATDGEIIAEVVYLVGSDLYQYDKTKYRSLDAAKAAVTRGLR